MGKQTTFIMEDEGHSAEMAEADRELVEMIESL